MAHFVSYDTSNTSTGNEPLQKNEVLTVGPLQTEKAQNIAGSVYSDVAGTLLVQQSFNEGKNWDISQSIAVVAKEGQGFNIAAIAPWVQMVYTNGGTNQTVMRLFARTFIQGN